MRYLLTFLAVFLSVSVFAQDFPIKADGETKYYIQIYDGNTNDKILYHNDAGASWKTKIQVTDFFDGSQNQLWSFTPTEIFPGYFHVRSHDEAYADRPEVFLMSWNWNAYLGGNHDPEVSMEMQFRLVEVTDGWYKLETIEKPNPYTGVAYTPGADALNINPEGIASFKDVKSADITPENMVNMAFKLVEFNPLKLFQESILRGHELYLANPTAPESVRYDLFYILEKARELRVFGTEAEMLAYQPTIDAAISQFMEFAGVLTVISDARYFITNSGADTETSNSFTQIIDDIEVYVNSEGFENSELPAIETEIQNAQSLVEAIVAAQTYAATLDQDLADGLNLSIDNAKSVLADNTSSAADYLTPISLLENAQNLAETIVAAQTYAATLDQDLADGLNLSIDNAKSVLADNTSSAADYLTSISLLENAQSLVEAIVAAQTYAATLDQNLADGLGISIDNAKSVLADNTSSAADYLTPISHLEKTQSIIEKIISAQNLIAETQDYPDEKAELNLAIDDAVAVINTVGTTDAQLEQALADIMAAIETFKNAMSTPLVLANADFEMDLADWNVEATDPTRAYAEDKGVDGSRSITIYSGSAYDMKVFQSITNIPNGTYLVSCYAKVNGAHGNIGLFVESDGVVEVQPVVSAGLEKYEVEVTVTNGAMEFGVKGLDVDNAIPGGNWIVFDQFDIKWSSKFAGQNFDFEQDLTSWDVQSATPAAAYPDSKGIDGSTNITCWSASAYDMSISQTHNPIANGEYEISAMGQTKTVGTFVVFGESDGVVNVEPITIVSQTEFEKYTTTISVTDNILKFGVKGAGVDNAVGAGEWVRFDNFEIVVKSITPEYVTVAPPKSAITLGIESSDNESNIVFAQVNNELIIRSNEAIVNYAVYSVTGSLVKQNNVHSNELSVSLKQGFYIVKVQTDNGFVDTKKIMIK